MSSKPPVLTVIRNPDRPTADTNLQLSAGDSSGYAAFIKGTKQIASFIRSINNYIQPIVNTIKTLISFISAGKNLFAGIIAIGKSVVEDALTLGGHAIIVHPWNQRNKAYKSLIYTSIDNKRKKTPTNAKPGEYPFTRVADWFDDTIETVASFGVPADIQGTAAKPGILNLGTPLLSIQGAINEVIWSFDNKKDLFRPKFTDRTYSTGMGIIMNCTNPLELNPLIDALKVLFDFSEFDKIGRMLEKKWENLERQVRNRGTGYLSALLNPDEGAYAEWQKEWEALDIKIEMEIMSVAEGQAKMDQAVKSNKGVPINQRKGVYLQPNVKNVQYDAQLVRNAIGKRLLTGDSGPRWFGLNLGMIPILKEIKEALDYMIDAMTYLTNTVSDSMIDVLTIIMKQIQFIMDTLERIASILESIDKMLAAFQFGGVWAFFIEPEVGGVNHLKEDLQALVPMLPNADTPGYTIMIFLTAGYPDYGSGNAYLKRLRGLLGDFEETMDEAYGLRIYLEPSPSSSYAVTNYNPTFPLAVKNTQIQSDNSYRDFRYQYSYRRYPVGNPLDAVTYTSGKKDSTHIMQLQALPEYIYELEVRADAKKGSDVPEKDFDIIYHIFRVIRKIEMSVASGSAVVEKVGTSYYLHIPVFVTVYNFQVATSINYTGGSYTMNITEYEIKANEEDIQYAEIPFDASYLITFTNGRPNEITDTIRGAQDQLTESSSFTITAKKLLELIADSNVPIGPEPIPITPEPETPEIIIPAAWPPNSIDSEIFCIGELIAKYLGRNKRCEIVLPEDSGKSIVFYDCQNVINSIRLHIVYNAGKYDLDKTDASSSRIPAEDYYYAMATTTSPVSFELTDFIRGYYVLRLDIYWKSGTVWYQKAGGVLPQRFDIYIRVVAGDTKCFIFD